MKKLLILTRFPGEYEPKRLAQAAQKRGIGAEIINYQKFWESGDFGEINKVDYLIPRSSAHWAKQSLIGLKTKILAQLPERAVCLNKRSLVEWPVLGKIKQAQILSRHGLPTIPSLRKPKFPMVLKAEFGSHSKRVFRVENQKELKTAKKAYPGKWLLQPLIKSPFYWRVIVLGGKSLGVMERKTSKRFFEPVSIKVSTYVHPGGVNIEQLGIKAAGVFQAEFAGVDILVDKQNKPLIIEVNRSPQFQIFEKKTGIDVAGTLIEYLTERLAGKNS